MVAPLTRALTQIKRGRSFTRYVTMEKPNAGQPEPDSLRLALDDAVSLFRELGIGYALIGGIAAMVYGRSRYTEDVDFVAQPDHESSLGAHPDVMQRFGFDPGCTWKRYRRSGIAIDVWKDEHAQDIVDRAVRRKLGRRFVAVAEVHDLIAMKLRADRPQDDYDISEIVKAQTIDEAVLAKRVSPAQLTRYRAIRKRVGL